jgi:hypothetical protein
MADRSAVLIILLLLFASLLPAQDEIIEPVSAIDAISVGITGAWTGNGYKPDPSDPGGIYDFDVTGSEGVPIDFSLLGGVRLTLAKPFLGGFGSLTLTPTMQLGMRRYLLYENGRVVPTQRETALGSDEESNPGLGSARVVTLRTSALLAYEITFQNRMAIVLGVSPTFLLRVRAGAAEFQSERSDLRPMYSFFYSRLRFLMPEVHVAFRFPLSEYLESTLFADYGVSVLDLTDTSLPVYDQMRVQVGIRFDLIPPYEGLLRDRDPGLTIPELDEQPSERETGP